MYRSWDLLQESTKFIFSEALHGMIPNPTNSTFSAKSANISIMDTGAIVVAAKLPVAISQHMAHWPQKCLITRAKNGLTILLKVLCATHQRPRDVAVAGSLPKHQDPLAVKKECHEYPPHP